MEISFYQTEKYAEFFYIHKFFLKTKKLFIVFLKTKKALMY